MQRVMQIITTSESELRAIEAVDKLARLAEVRAKILGFTAPAKQEIDVTHQHTITAGVDDRIEELLKMRQGWVERNQAKVEAGQSGEDIIDAEVVEDEEVAPLVERSRAGEDEAQGGEGSNVPSQAEGGAAAS